VLELACRARLPVSLHSLTIPLPLRPVKRHQRSWAHGTLFSVLDAAPRQLIHHPPQRIC